MIHIFLTMCASRQIDHASYVGFKIFHQFSLRSPTYHDSGQALLLCVAMLKKFHALRQCKERLPHSAVQWSNVADDQCLMRRLLIAWLVSLPTVLGMSCMYRNSVSMGLVIALKIHSG